MKNALKYLPLCFFMSFVEVMLPSCRFRHEGKPLPSADSLRIVQEVLAHRAAVDSFFRFDPDSPFQRDTSITYRGIRWFPPDPDFCFRSKLYRYDTPETVVVMGTHGEERRHLKYGYFPLRINGSDVRLNVYKFLPQESKRFALYGNHLNVWFTDRTTGRETYEVGRYLDVGTEMPDPEYIYTINFNNAYNPYCAYSDLYSCAIPRREDHLDVEIRAGEMKYSNHHSNGTQTTLHDH